MSGEQLIRENFPFYNGQDFGMVEEDTVVQLAGNGVTLWNTGKRSCENIEVVDRNGYSTVATSLSKGLIACTEYGLQPKCHIFDANKRGAPIHSFQLNTTLKCLGMSFSRDGCYLVIIGGVPDFKISIYSLENSVMLNMPETKLPCNYKSFVEVQMNPKSKDEFAILADQALYFYTLKPAFQQVEQNNEDEEGPQYVLEDAFRLEMVQFLPDDVPVSEDNPPDGPIFFTSFKWDNYNRVHLCSNTEQILQITSRQPHVEQTLDLQAVPMTTCLTQSHLIVATEDGMINWYNVDIPYGDPNSDQSLTLKDEIQFEYQFADQLGDNSAPASFMHYSRKHSHLVIGTRNGVISRLGFEALIPIEDDDEENQDDKEKEKTAIDVPLEVLGRFHTAAVVGLKSLGDSSQFVTISKDQTMAIWETSDMQQISNIPQMTQPTAMGVSVDGHSVFIGFEAGEFNIFDVSNRQNPRLIKQFRFYEDESPITNVHVTDDGVFLLISSSESDTIWIMSQDPARDYDCFGFIKMEGYVLSCMISHQAGKPKAVAVLSNNLMQTVNIPTGPQEARLEALSDDITMPVFRKIDRGSHSIICHPEYKNLMVTGEDKWIKIYEMWPQEQFDKIVWKSAPTVPNDEIPSHPLGTSCIETQPDRIITGGKDGTIMLREAKKPENGAEFQAQAHTVAAGGVTALSSFTGRQLFYTAGGDGSICIWFVDGADNDVPRQPVQSSTPIPQALANYRSDEPLPIEELPLCKDVMTEQFFRSKQADKEQFRQELVSQISKVAERLADLLNENQHVTDLEQLDRGEFVIDLNRETRYNEEEEQVCKEIGEEAEKTVLKFELLKERVQGNTWDQMRIKSTACRSLMSTVLLYNYAVRGRGLDHPETRIMEQIKIQRKVELMQKYNRLTKLKEEIKNQGDCLREPIQEAEFSAAKEQYFMNRTTGRPNFMTDDAIEKAAQKFKDEEEKRRQARLARQMADQQTTAGETKDGPRLVITKGKLNVKSRKGPESDIDPNKGKVQNREVKNMDSMHWRVVFLERELDELKEKIGKPESELDIYDLLYDTFELYTDKRKRFQIEMVRQIVFEIKQDFNSEFTQLQKDKVESIFKIKDWQGQIDELLENLGEPADTDTALPSHVLEDPEYIFKINPEDITVDRYLTKEEKEAAAEEERKKEEAEARLKSDNVGRRGLKAMYGGTDLIMKIERGGGEQELEKEEWMNKPEEEMNEEEKIKYQDYLAQLKTQQDNKRRRWLAELEKRRKDIYDEKIEFEEKMLELYKKRLFYEARIYEQELYIVRMIIMLHEKRETHIDKIKFRNEREEMLSKVEDKQAYLLNCEDYTTEQEQNIRSDTSIQSHEQIVKSIARKEGFTVREVMDFVVKGFGKARVQVSEERRQDLMKGIVDLDPFSFIDKDKVNAGIKVEEEEEKYVLDRDCPTDITPPEFQKYMGQREIRIQLEKTRDTNNKRLNQLKDHLNYLRGDLNGLTDEFNIVDSKCKKIEDRASKLKFNFEVIVYLKQGQVEVPQLPVATDYKDAILIKEDIIKDENKKIEQKGRQKVTKMGDILNAQTKLKLHETESKIKELKIIDYEQRAMDVQLYRVTKQTQEIIMQKNIKKDEDVKKRLENQIKALDDNTKKRINDITTKLKKMQRDIKEKSVENEELERKARVLKQAVEARQQIIDLRQTASNDGGNDPTKKFKEVANQRKMMDVIKQQEEEIMFLQDELDRLRARTFPSFAHLQNKAEFPDQR